MESDEHAVREVHKAWIDAVNARIRCISELEEVVVLGEVAHTLSRDSLSLTPRAGGQTTELAGHRITIYRKQPDGRWLLARDAHTLSSVTS